jgi:hypothetical protein
VYFMSALLSLFLWSILNDFEHSKISLFIVHSGLATKDVFVESKLSLDRGCLVHYCIADIAGRNANNFNKALYSSGGLFFILNWSN